MENDRAQTDKSLSTERNDADTALRDTQDAERAADRVVDLARRKADAVLVTARDKADESAEASPAFEKAIVGSERAQADRILQGERMAADDRLRLQREDERRALAELLPFERDTTDRDLLIERARSDEAIVNRDDFLAMVSHDLRNLLGGIVLSSRALSKGASDTDEGRRIVATGEGIQRYSARMNRLIGDLVDVVSIDAGKMASTVVPGDPLALITDTLGTFATAAANKGIALESEVTGILPLANLDYERMLQVFANIVSNALKFTARGGKIRIRGESTGDEVHFSVSDTGVGIDPSMLASIFLRFWQTGKNAPRGVGLGLYISKCLVEAHKGRIWVESTVGQGSTFHFTVPLASRS